MSVVFSLEMYYPFYLVFVFKVVRPLRVSFFSSIQLYLSDSYRSNSPCDSCSSVCVLAYAWDFIHLPWV